MALIIADRVKETTTTTGTGNISLSGRTFGGFQTFAEAIGDGNTTYYCIQNDSQFEIGLGTYNEGTNTLNRDTVFQSSNNDNKINIDGIGIVFCVVPADRIVYKDADNAVVFPTPFAFKRSDDGDYWQAYSTDYTNRISSFFLEEGTDPVWKIGLKTTANQLVAPYYAYISGKDGFIELRGNGSSILSIGDGANEGLQVNHQLKNIIDIRKNGGEIAIQNLDLNSDETTSAKNNSIAYTVFAVESSAGHAADLQTWSVATDEKASLNQYGDFSDGSTQTTAALPFSSGALIDQNAADIVTQSGYFQDYIDGLDHSATAVSGWARSYIDQTSGNLQDAIDQNISDIAVVSGLIGDADFLPGGSGSLIDQNTADIIIASGALRDSINELDSDLTTASGALRDSINQTNTDLATASGALRDSINQNTSDIGTVSGLLTPSGESFDFTSNILTYNNSDGGSFTADLSSLSTFDTSGVSLAYSAGTLTYTNNAGGSFDVDLSSISGDVYAMIVDGAPSTLDTLNEIAAALNNDSGIANTLISLVSTTSGNLQSQITDNDSDISYISGVAEFASGQSLTGMEFDIGGSNNEYRINTTFVDLDGTQQVVRNASINGDGYLQLEVANFSPVVSAVGQTNLNWDQPVTQWSVSVDNPTDFLTNYVSGVKSPLTGIAGSITSDVTLYSTSGPSATPAGGVDWNQTFNTDGDSPIYSTTSDLTGGSASATVSFLDKNGATLSDTASISFSWKTASNAISFANLSGKNFLETYLSTTYNLTISNISNIAGNTSTTITSSQGSLSNSSDDGTITFTTPIHKDNTTDTRIITATTDFTRPSTVTGSSYTSQKVSSDSTISASFTYPSFYIFTASSSNVPSRADIVDVDDFSSSVTELGNLANSFAQNVTVGGSVPQCFWFAVKSSISQPTSFQTGSSASLLSDVSVTQDTVNLEPDSPPAGYVAEGYNLYGITLQAGTTYVSIS
jgi:hypothetical protein